ELAGKPVACPKCKALIPAPAAMAPMKRAVQARRIGPPSDDEPDVVAVDVPDEPADRAPVRPVRKSALPDVPQPRRPKPMRKRSPKATKQRRRAVLFIGSGIAVVLMLAAFVLWQILRPLPDFSTPGEVGAKPADVGPVIIAEAPAGDNKFSP